MRHVAWRVPRDAGMLPADPAGFWRGWHNECHRERRLVPVKSRVSVCSVGALVFLACSDEGPPASSGNLAEDPGEGVELQLPTGAFEGLAQTLASDAQDDADSLARRYAVPFSDGLGYDPFAAPGLSKIIDSMLGDSSARTNGVAALGRAGFVIGTSRTAPSFPQGYSWIYSEHLP